MKFTFTTENKTKTVNIPDKDIQRLMDKYKLSKDEAIYTWLVDEDYVKDPRVEELEKKAKENKVSREARAIKIERKAREKKENPLKKAIILSILEGLNGYFGSNGEISIRNDEKYIDISFEDREFTINLVEHRRKKDESAR